MSQDYSKLSYKELQAMAAKHQIPGNIKKGLLIDLLRALKCGDKVQVTRMLSELKENRKRKVRKRKLEKMTAVTSTPLHSPNYSSIEDRFYSPQHLSPFRWATSEEEMIRREDPHYEMFRQYLIHRIQKGFQNFDTNNNDVGLDPATLNLKTCVFESNSQSNVFVNPTASNPIAPSPVPDAQVSGNKMESQTENDINETNYRPMILQKMLQAPLGTNLGAMARLEANRMWSTEHFHSLREIEDNNSDTLTADSESMYDEWDERTDYYNVVDIRRAQNITEQNQIPQFTLEQMINYLQSYNQSGHQHNNQFDFLLPNIQENCQTWVENNSLEYRGPIDYVETNDSSKIYASNSAEEQTNYQYQTDETFPMFGQNNQQNENNGLQVQNMNSYFHSELPSQQMPPSRQEYIDETNPTNVCSNNVPFSTNVIEQFSALQSQDLSNFGIYSQESVTSMPYLCDEHFQYPMVNEYQQIQLPTYSVASNFAQPNYYTQNGEQNAQLRPTSVSATQKEGNNFLNPYWPRWSDNSEGFQLENILNLNVGVTIDYSKFNQTSTVYCFAPPLSSPMSGTSSSQHIERAELVSAGGFHAFAPKSLIYNDSTTGMRMAKLPVDILEETGSEESSITIGYRSDESYHREPIQEIWIPDFISNREENDSNDILSSSCETIPD